jgi:hypothetical protein
MKNTESILSEYVYQTFLIEICKVCDEIYLREKKVIDLTFREKEELAQISFEFLADILKEVSKGNCFEYLVNKKKYLQFLKFAKKKYKEDLFVKYFLLHHISEGKLSQRNFLHFFTTALLKVLKYLEEELEIKSVNPKILRIAAIVTPLINFSNILKMEMKKGTKNKISYIG